jgi:hypothetical protein
MARNAPLAVVLVAFLALLLASCGNGGSGEQTQGQPSAQILPKQQFVNRAKAICAAARKRMGEGSEAFLKRRADETGEAFGAVGQVDVVPEVVVPTLRRELRELEALGLPEGEAYAVETLWQTFGTVLHEVEVEGRYIWRTAKVLVPFHNQAKPFGLQGCIVN